MRAAERCRACALLSIAILAICLGETGPGAVSQLAVTLVVGRGFECCLLASCDLCSPFYFSKAEVRCASLITYLKMLRLHKLLPCLVFDAPGNKPETRRAHKAHVKEKGVANKFWRRGSVWVGVLRMPARGSFLC